MADQKPTLAQDDDAATPQDQLKPAEGHFGQNSPTPGLTDIQGASGPAGNDQAGGGLGQNHAGYGGDNAPTAGQSEVTAGDAQRQASQGVAARSDNLGPSPTSGGQQPRSTTTGGPDLSKGLTDTNRGGGSF